MNSDTTVPTKDEFLKNLDRIDKLINESRKLGLEIRQDLKIVKENIIEIKNYLNEKKQKNKN